MKARHITTLENAPADFLIHGSAALQGYEADCFAMGLCLLHLLTGRAPYEELFAGLTCPPELADALRAAWASAPEHDVIREHLEGDDDNGAVLADTLYRYVCMFGGLADGATRKRGASACAVWAALGAWHGTKAGRKAYARDAATWSVLTGKHEVCVHVRRRMDALPGSAELLRGLVDFDPASRWTVERALTSDFFAPARERSTTASERFSHSRITATPARRQLIRRRSRLAAAPRSAMMSATRSERRRSTCRSICSRLGYVRNSMTVHMRPTVRNKS